MKTLVCITSYNRQQSLARIVANIATQDCDIIIFDDHSPKMANFATPPRIAQITNPEHRGKAGFWQTYNDIFNYCKSHEYDYYIILPDDVEPCPYFVSRAIAAYEAAGCISLSPFVTNRTIAPGISRWGRKPIEDRESCYLTQYFDCCGIVRRDFFEALDWQLDPITPHTNPLRSSGVGRQITLRLQALGKPMGHTKRTLLATTDDPSAMNAEERKRHPMYCDWRNNDSCVDVHIASLWRGGHLVKTAESLLRQPELATLFVTLNSYTPAQEKETRAALKGLADKYGKKVTIRKAANQKGSNEKLSQLTKGKARFIAFADDDILYPSNHLMQLVMGCEIHNAAVSFHGARLRRFPIRKYYNGDREVKAWNIAIEADTRVDILGSGVGLLRREWFTDEELKALYVNAPTVSMDDIILSCALSQKGISRWVLEHGTGYLQLKDRDPSDNYVYDRYKDDDSAQVEYLNANYRK